MVYYIFSSDNNDLGPEGAICIRNLVQENRSIKKLSLRSNGFVDSDCLELFEGKTFDHGFLNCVGEAFFA